jgi:hypothetical protein
MSRAWEPDRRHCSIRTLKGNGRYVPSVQNLAKNQYRSGPESHHNFRTAISDSRAQPHSCDNHPSGVSRHKMSSLRNLKIYKQAPRSHHNLGALYLR